MRGKISNTLGLFLFLVLLPIHTQGMEDQNADLPPIVQLNFNGEDSILFTQDNTSIEPQALTSPMKDQNADLSSVVPLTLSDEVAILIRQIDDTDIDLEADSTPKPTPSKKLSEIEKPSAPASPLQASPAKKKRKPFIIPKEGSQKSNILCQSYQAPQLIFQLWLMDSGPNLIDSQSSKDYKNSQAFKEAQADQKYYSDHQLDKRPFSAQPAFEELTNKVGSEVVKAAENHQKELEEYRNANKDLLEALNAYQKEMGRTLGQQNGGASEKLTAAQETFKKIQEKYIKSHMPLEVIRGGRPITTEQLQKLEKQIFRTPIQIITWKPYITMATGTSYRTHPHRMEATKNEKGFLLNLCKNPLDFYIACKMLKGLLARLDRETAILNCVWMHYQRDFLPKVQGWEVWQISNYLYDLRSIVETEKIALKELIEKEFLPHPSLGRYSRDRSTDQGIVLALLYKDERGQFIKKHIYPLIGKLKKSPEEEFTPEQIKAIQDGSFALQVDKEYHALQTLTVDSGNSNDIPSLKPFPFFYTGVDIVEENDNAVARNKNGEYDFSFLDPDYKPIYFYQIKIRRTDALEIFKVPEKVQMATEFRSYQTMHAHRKKWIQVLKGLHRRFFNDQEREQLLERSVSLSLQDGSIIPFKNPKELYDQNTMPDFLREHESIESERKHKLKIEKKIEKYQKRLKNYKKLLEERMKLQIDLQTNSGLMSSIPKGDTFAYEDRPPNKSISFQHTIDLSNLGLNDTELQILRPGPQGDIPLLSPYMTALLPNNRLTGTENYGFSQLMTRLIVDHNALKSLEFIKGLLALKEFKASGNTLSDLSPIATCPALETVDLSDNQIHDIEPLGALKKLRDIDLSTNRITSLTFTTTNDRFSSLRSLKVNNNNLTGYLGDIFPVTTHLLTLEVRGNEKLGLSSPRSLLQFDADYFKLPYPKLKTLKTDKGDFTWNAELPAR